VVERVIADERTIVSSQKTRTQQFLTYLNTNKILLLMLLPGLISLVLFKLAPLGGMVIAFQDFSAFKGVLNSPFVGFEHFQRIFEDPYIWTLVKNTLILAFYSLLFTFPIPVLFALLLNEVRVKWVKGSVQSLSFLPYFISSAVMVSIIYTLLSPSTGLVNDLLGRFGVDPIYFMAEPGWFRSNYVVLQVWQTFGYSAIVYIAAMASIDPAIYESASLDGASRFQQMMHITLPSLRPTIAIMLIISVGNIFTVDLDRILLMYNQSIYATADVIQTYVYRLAFASTGFPEYSYGTAVNLLKSVVAYVLVIGTNKLSTKYSDTRLF